MCKYAYTRGAAAQPAAQPAPPVRSTPPSAERCAAAACAVAHIATRALQWCTTASLLCRVLSGKLPRGQQGIEFGRGSPPQGRSSVGCLPRKRPSLCRKRMADAWADEPETTPAQRAAAIADKAVDEITNQGYHYWCATRVRCRGGLPLLARPAVRCPSACERPHVRALSVLAQCAISARSVPRAAPTHQHRSQFHSQRTRRSASHERSSAACAQARP